MEEVGETPSYSTQGKNWSLKEKFRKNITPPKASKRTKVEDQEGLHHDDIIWEDTQQVGPEEPFQKEDDNCRDSMTSRSFQAANRHTEAAENEAQELCHTFPLLKD